MPIAALRKLAKLREDERAPALLCLLGVLCLAYLPLFLGQIVFFRDVSLWNYPARWFLRDAILRGDSPFWNPHQGIGLSVASNPLYGVFYPPNWLFLLVPSDLVASMLGWQNLAHLFWGGAGMVLLARRMGAAAVGSSVAGMAWSLSGFGTALWSTGLLLLASSWFPWVALSFLSLEDAARQGRGAALVGMLKCALPIGMLLLLGEVFFAVVGVGFGLATLVAYLAFSGAPSTGWLARAARLAGAIVLGVGTGSVSWLPAWAAVHETSREAVRFGAVTASLNPYRVVEMVAPNCMGFVSADYPASPWVGEAALLGFPLIFSVYLGASVVALGLAAFGRHRRLALCLAGLSVVALLVAMGRFTPVYKVVVTVLPFFANMRSPEKYFILVVAWAALLAGLGAARLFDGGAQPWRRTAILAALLVAWAMLCPAVLPSERWAMHMRRGALLGASAVAGVLVIHWLIRRGSGRLAGWIAIATVAADLVAAGLPLHELAPRRLANEVPLTATTILADDRGGLVPPRLHVSPAAESVASESVTDDNIAAIQEQASRVLSANLSITYGVAAMPGYDAATPRALHRLSSIAQKAGAAALRLAGTKYVILPAKPGDPSPVGLERMAEIMPRVWLFRVRDPLPRAFVAGRTELLGDDEIAGRLLSDEVVQGRSVLLAAGQTAAPVGGQAERPGDCRIDSYRNAEVRATCRADRDAVAVFVEQFFPGWTATVDGQSAPLWRANMLMRAVPMPKGEHTIVMRYRPVGVATAEWLSLVFVLALASMAAAYLMGRRCRRAAR